MRHKTIWLLAVCSLLIGLLVACNGEDDDAPLPESQPLLHEAADNFEQASAFQMQLRQSGERPLIAETLGFSITFDRAEAVFVAPDRISALVNVVIDALTQELELIIIGDQQYAKNRFLTTGQWQVFPFATGFEAGDLQSPVDGIGAALRSITEATVQGRQDLDGVEVYHLTGSVPADRVASVTVGLIGTTSGTLSVEVYVRTRDSYLARIVITEPTTDDNPETEATVWTVDFTGYNRDDLAVESPEDPLPPATPQTDDDTPATNDNEG